MSGKANKISTKMIWIISHIRSFFVKSNIERNIIKRNTDKSGLYRNLVRFGEGGKRIKTEKNIIPITKLINLGNCCF